MGQALADIAPMLDSIVAGEADLSFPQMCDAYLQFGTRPPRVVDCGHLPNLDQTSAQDFSASTGSP